MGTFYCASTPFPSGFCNDRRWNHDIYAIDPDGTDRTQIISTSQTAEMDPNWSPDGTQIAFSTDGFRTNLTGVGVMDADGTNRRTLVPGGIRPDWSPDGTMLVYQDGDISVVNVATGAVVDKGWGHNDDVAFPDWSPDGATIAFNWGNGIRITDARAFTVPFSAGFSNPIHFFEHNCGQPAWSPDGTKLACVWDRSLPNFGGRYQEIGVITVATGAIEDVTRMFESDGQKRTLANPEWSPDGTTIAFVDLTGAPGTGHVRVVPAVFNASDPGGAVANAGPNLDFVNEFNNSEQFEFSEYATTISWKEGTPASPEEDPDPFPAPDAGGPYSGNEGADIALDATGSTGTGTLSYGWDTDGDGDFSDATGASPTVSFPDNGTYVVAVQVTDGNGSIATDTAEVTVSNVAPALSDVIGTMSDDGNAWLTGVIDDPGAADTLSARVDWGDGSPVEDATLIAFPDGMSFAAGHAYSAPGDYDVTVTAADHDEDSDSETVSLIRLPANDAPASNDLNADTEIGVPVEVTFEGNDPDGGPDPLTFEITQQPSNGSLLLVPDLLLSVGSSSAVYVPDQSFEGTDTFSYRATDGESASTPSTVTVRVAAPEEQPPGEGPPGPGPQPTVEPTVTPTTSPSPEPTIDPDVCTVRGTPGDDSLEGTTGADVICGGDGDDEITGFGGNDLLRGGAGNDILRGGRGDDVLRPHGGDDEVYGGPGSDVGRGRSGSDLMYGNGGADVLRGAGHDDSVSGGRGRDRVFGGSGGDRVLGGPGRDVIDGGPGGDFCDITAADRAVSCEIGRGNSNER
jgi:Ca2+-binding RTX toxin-like protein